MTTFQSLFALPGGQLRSDSIVLGTGGDRSCEGFHRREEARELIDMELDAVSGGVFNFDNIIAQVNLANQNATP